MFGNKKRLTSEEIEYMKEQLEKDKIFFDSVISKGDMLQANYEELEDSRQMMVSSLKQLDDNADKVKEFSNDSISGVTALNDSFTECVKAAAQNLENLEEAARAVAKQYEDTCQLVENNKHFTTPSKSLSESPGKIKDAMSHCTEIVDQMEEQNKQMSVLSLNAAIEAGMLGEEGRLFVEAAESIKTASMAYETAISAMKEELTIADAEVEGLKETIIYLVNLLKENNIATAKLMKQGAELNRVFSKCDEISVDIIESCRQQIFSIKNMQEEILKHEDRNKLQLEDIMSELTTQDSNSTEIKVSLDQIVEYSRERTKL